VNTETSTKPGTGGVTLHTIRWTPDAQPSTQPTAEILLVHGYGEHSGRYEHVAQRLCDAGFAVTSLDHRGHGRSTGVERGTVDNFDLLVDDLASVVTDLSSGTSDGVPLFVYGHSMGGLATVRLAERGDERFAGLIITGPALQTAASVPKPVLAIANALGRIAPNLPTIELDGDAISRVPAVRADYDADPLNFRGKVTTGTARAAVGGHGGRDGARPPTSRAPILIMHGSDDTLADPAGSVRFSSARSGRATGRSASGPAASTNCTTSRRPTTVLATDDRLDRRAPLAPRNTRGR
jgi:alpha-beta hydrolase superfamily lysophospholipase